MKRYLYFFCFILLISFISLPLFQTANATTYSYTYTFIGPYSDDGGSPIGVTTSVEGFNVNGSTYSFTLVNSGSGFQTVVVTSSTPPSDFLWYSPAMATLSPSNVSRTYVPTSNTETIYVHIPTAGQPIFVYTFNVADFYGMINPYLETTVTTGGLSYVVEKQSLNTTGIVSFIMSQWTPYGLTFICNQGTYSQSFFASTVFTNNLQVLAGAFPSLQTNQSGATATRLNSTALQINYTDPDAVTSWLYYTITHQDGSYFVTDYSNNLSTTNSFTTTATVDNQTDYLVMVQAYRYGQITEWDFSCPTNSIGTNPFSGLLDWLGTWPTGVDPAQLVGAAIIMCALGLGSFRSAGFSCIFAIIITGVLMAMGWFTMGIPMFAFTFVLGLFVLINEGKDQARDV